jgi:dCMP deaminase
MIDPHKPKYFPLYWAMAEAAAKQSLATRLKVGAVVVTPTGMISPGWNGMPAGFDNKCEHWVELTPAEKIWDDADRRLETKPEVIHAERNAIDKMTRQGISTQGSLLFVTHAPCFECSKAIHGLGLKAVYYKHAYRCDKGLQLLERAGVQVIQHT